MPFFLAVLAFYLWNNWVWLLIVAAGAFGSWWVEKAVHMRRTPRTGPVSVRQVVYDIKEAPTALDLELEDARYEGTGWRVLEVRKWWARIAAGMDAFILANIGLVTVAIFSNPATEAKHVQDSTSDAATYISIPIGLAVFGFNIYAHKKATQPRKPKRAWLPAFLRTNV
jgi:hypothetical protein